MEPKLIDFIHRDRIDLYSIATYRGDGGGGLWADYRKEGVAIRRVNRVDEGGGDVFLKSVLNNKFEIESRNTKRMKKGDYRL